VKAPWDILEPAARQDIERGLRAVGRVERLTSTVFALSMALLVLVLFLPILAASPERAAQGDTLREMLPALGACFLSFVLLFSCWVLHHFQLHYFVRTGGETLWVNAAMMMFVALVPFSTALLSARSIASETAALYAANFLAIQALLLLNWNLAVKTGLLFGGNMPGAVARRMRLVLTVSSGYGLGTVLLAWTSPHATVSMLAMLAAFHVFLTARGGYTLNAFRRRPAPPPDSPWPL